MVLCLVQRLLSCWLSSKQCNPLNVISHIFRFENYCHQLIIMDVGAKMTHYVGNMTKMILFYFHEPSSLFHHSVLVDLSVSMMMH